MKRATAEQLLNHKFIISNKNPNNITASLMQQLPPNWQLFEILQKEKAQKSPVNEDIKIDANAIAKKEEILHNPQFIFVVDQKNKLEPSKRQKEVKQGQEKTKSTKRFSLIVTHVPKSSKKDLPQISKELNEITQKVTELENKNQDIQRIIDETRKQVQEMLAKKKK